MSRRPRTARRRRVPAAVWALLVLSAVCLGAVWSMHQMLTSHGARRFLWSGVFLVDVTVALAWVAITVVQLRRQRKEWA